MKKTRNLLLAGTVAALCCSTGKAQFVYPNTLPGGGTLIYSNAFNGGAVNITNSPPTFSTNLLGGSNNAVWLDVGASGETNALYANGTANTALGDTWLLPFTPKSGYVYNLTATVDLTGGPSSWVVAGYAQKYTNFPIASAPPNSSINAYAWTLRNASGNTEFFAGAAGANNVYNSTPAGPTGSGNYTYNQILDTTGSKWVVTAFFGGVQLGAPYTFPANPTIASIAIGQHALSIANTYHWTSLALSASPIVIGQQPVSANVDAGTGFTNTVAVVATSPSYQWYNNNVPIAGATTASLPFSSVSATNASTNYYVVITNSFGSVTSSVVGLTVYTSPVFSAAYPVPYTSPMNLFAGTNIGGSNYLGASPTFSVSVLGGLPITYQWLTNGVTAGGVTGSSFSLTNCQFNSPTSVACIATNSYGSATNSWSIAYVQTPTAPYPQTVLANQPLGFWRLDETSDDGNGDDGVLALDMAGGNNGIYTNAYFDTSLGSYSPLTDPSESAVAFSAFAYPNSDAFNIQGINFAAPTNVNAVMSAAIWVNGTSPANNSGIIAKGVGGSEQFVLDTSGGKYRFSVHDAAGGLHSALATVGPNGTWQYVVGVCDEANGVVVLYVNGLQAASAAISTGSGLLATTVPMTIGARASTIATSNDWQFSGDLSQAAVFNRALPALEVAVLYQSAGYTIPISFIAPLPPTNAVFQANTTLTIPATLFSVSAVGYYWSNLTTGAIIASGVTNGLNNLNATLTIPNAPVSLSGDQLELVVTNGNATTNWFVSLFSPAPPVTVDYSNPILYSNDFNGGTWSIAGFPLSVENALIGGTNTKWVDAIGTNDTGIMQANGTPATTNADCWLVPFTPRAGYVYTVTASVTFLGNPGNWIAMGFGQNLPTNAAAGSGQFNQSGVNGLDWILLNENGNTEYFINNSTMITNATLFTGGAGTHTVTVALDTTGAQWVIYAFVDGVSAGTNTFATNPTIASVGIGQNSLTVPSMVRWNSFTVTQVAPNGVPPYLFAPLPPTSITLGAGSPLSISASAYGSTPFGYYWINTNTATVLASGATSTLAPFSANLSVASVPGSWNGNTLALYVTNAYGTNLSLVALTVTNSIIIPTIPPTITGFSLVNLTNVTVTGTNAQSGGTYYLLSTTNVATPLNQWIPLATNVIVTNGSAGGFTVTETNIIHAGSPQQFFILGNTN